MTNCYDEGRLRAYLDGELAVPERAALDAHLAGCAACRTALAEQRGAAGRVRAVFATAPEPNPRAALARLRQGASPGTPAVVASSHPAPTTERRSIPMQTHSGFWAGRRRPLVAAAAALVAVLSLLALPPVRAAADDLLSIFRVQQLMFVPVSGARMEQLQGLNLDGQNLFLSKPAVESQAPPRTVGSADEAAGAVGYAIEQPAQLPSPPLQTEYSVASPGTGTFTVNVETARRALELLGITDVTIPDALGAGPITVAVPPFATAHYQGATYDLTLSQGHSPSVTLPDGVELADLGKAALRVLGMTAEQAETASQGINWNNTLLFPFPADTNNVRQVTVNGQSGLLVTSGGRGDERAQLLWQRDEQFYMLEGSSNAREEELIDLLLTTAESVR
jgi:hypothetical protein